MSETGQMDWAQAQSGNAPATYHEFLLPPMFEPCAERLLDAAEAGTGNRIIDVACGTGAVTRAAARRAGTAGSVLGIDLTEPMLAVARGVPAQEGAAPIEYVLGDAGELPAPDGEADVATCQHGLQFFPDRVAALREMARVTRPGGRVAVACWAKPPANPTFGLLADALERHLGGEAGGGMRQPFSLGDPAELAALLDAAGLVDVTVVERSWDAEFAAGDDFAERCLQAGPLWPVFLAAPDESRRALVDEVNEVMGPYRTADGTISEPITTLVAVGRV